MDDNVLQKLHPCIVITGKGFPDVSTRMMVRQLWCTLQIPILALVDADPHGIEILSVYKFGSKALSFDAHRLTVPVIKWLGVLPTDINRLSISHDQLIPLTDRDKCKARELLERPYIKITGGLGTRDRDHAIPGIQGRDSSSFFHFLRVSCRYLSSCEN
ncbi:endodeoxyribonuclease [Desmophyllum pertusum]|uniref:Endodeoxyribonuclease n=1 Tax=Desmophyllum pertusum TaxID=174260 RepID=A0A9X0D5Y2_9CNID|nr:endodeoxyribonuclease [Desmophyllum pertusum]